MENGNAAGAAALIHGFAFRWPFPLKRLDCLHDFEPDGEAIGIALIQHGVGTLGYQDRVLERLDGFLDALKEHKANSDELQRLKQERPNLALKVPDFAADAWES